ncbi:D-ribose pyranase [Acetivibrio clariflavus]|uniref:D-ribose pyranase n=1 Tax=Acetivibrio clariflavus (strain DSM 19732 / NBRC 101661 / EBR45) TaxID=720554 RepID=G8LVS6_ACECE|nr:D-ribose pyranase [Acetivibrio clariflavus]AEV67493.1 ABC-type ribose transport system, auxiliary component [Acetivibrio clariflavus DSM 19732]HOQ01741.1 D-ribose pyranase [Acetivibrio clariflavus]
MKKTKVLNSELSAVIASMGHTDTIAIGDAGLPIPDSSKRIDLAVKRNLPPFLDVLETVLCELEVEEVTIASEMIEDNPGLFKKINELFSSIKINLVTHSEFKEMTKNCKAVVRTGECMPYANIILHSGVAFSCEE